MSYLALKARFNAHVAEAEIAASGAIGGSGVGGSGVVSGSAAHVWTRGNAGASPLREIGIDANDVHAVASLLKLWYREMCEPLLTAALYLPLVSLQALVARRGGGAPRVAAELWGQGASSGGGAMAALPSCHAWLLSELVRFLRRLSIAHAEMTAKNVAICIAPTVLRPATDLDPMARLSQLQSVRLLGLFFPAAPAFLPAVILTPLPRLHPSAHVRTNARRLSRCSAQLSSPWTSKAPPCLRLR